MTNKQDKCKNCGHNASMHSNGQYCGAGECFIKLRGDEFCDCSEFRLDEEGK